jgi:hypothetical protein
MNEAEFPSINLDELRLLPNWLREEGPPPSKQYAGHAGETEQRPGDRRGGRFPERGGERRDARRPREGGPGRPGGGDGRPRGKSAGRPDRRDGDPRRAEGPGAPPARPAPVRIEFQPDERCLASIVKQIRSTHLAYPLFGLARMFLQEPERHWLQLTLEPEAVATGAQLYQLGEEGPVTLNRETLEKIAFDETRERSRATTRTWRASARAERCSGRPITTGINRRCARSTKAASAGACRSRITGGTLKS